MQVSDSVCNFLHCQTQWNVSPLHCFHKYFKCYGEKLWRFCKGIIFWYQITVSKYCTQGFLPPTYPPFSNCSCEIFKKANSKNLYLVVILKKNMTGIKWINLLQLTWLYGQNQPIYSLSLSLKNHLVPVTENFKRYHWSIF